MSENISKQTVQHVANLAKIRLDDQQLEKMVSQLDEVLELVDTLNEVDTSNTKATYSISKNVNQFRNDESKDWQQTKQLVDNAPEHNGNLLQVPTILEEGSDNA